MKKAIICFPFVEGRQTQYPTGIYRIASFCKDFYDIIIVDQRLDSNVKGTISALLEEHDDILCLGLSVMTGQQIESAIDISKSFHDKVSIVWGGVHPTILPTQTLDNDFVDFVVIGEGEEAFLNLLRHLEGKAQERQLFLSKSNDSLEYNFLADLNVYVDFQKYRIRDEYIVKRDGFVKAFTLETSRGCPYKCSFCHNSVYNKPYRFMNADYIAQIIDNLKSDYDIDGLAFQEDNFFANLPRVKSLMGLLTEKGIGWKANSRINYFYKLVDDTDFMGRLLVSGCRVLQFGLESGSPRILKLINKNIDIAESLVVNKKLAQYPIRIRYNFIVAFPGETLEEIHQTFRLIEELRKENPYVEPPFVNIYNPYPGTALYQAAIEHGFREPKSLDEWSKLNWQKAWSESFSPEINEFIEQKSLAFSQSSCYLRAD